MSAARARPPVPPPSRRARTPHLPPSFAPVTTVPGHSGHTPGYAIASARPPPPCSARHPHSHRLFSRACRMLCLQHAPVRPSLHLLAVPALRTCHRPLRPCRPSLATQATCPVTGLRQPAPSPSCSARHPHLHRSLSRVCDPQHVPARPPLYLLAVPVTRTCTVLLAVSAILSMRLLARPSTSLQSLSPTLAPFS